jgi:MFS family permease
VSVITMEEPAESAAGIVAPLLPIMLAVLVVFLVIGLALPVLPLHVHSGLGLGTFVVGLVTGAQFATSLISRVWSGHFSDTRGAKRAVVAGLVGASAAGLFYLASMRFVDVPALSAAILICGRALLGGSESFIITGALGWGLALLDARHTGKVIAWVGTAMYAAFAIGAPLGGLLYARYGFLTIALATTLVPLLAVLIVAVKKGVAPHPRAEAPLNSVLRAVWLPGVGLALSSIGFGAVTTFVALLFAAKSWSPVWLPLSVFALAFMVVRLAFGSVPDRFGGARVALASVVVEVGGLTLIWAAPSSGLALAGAALTGLGYSLVYPGFGIESVRRVAPQSRGLAMGTYTAFLDLALGIAGPMLGLLGTGAGLGSVFLAAAIVVLGAAAVAVRLMWRPER